MEGCDDGLDGRALLQPGLQRRSDSKAALKAAAASPAQSSHLILPYLSTQFVHFFLVVVAVVALVVVVVVAVVVVDVVVVVVVVVVVFLPLKSKTAKMSIKTQLCSSFSYFLFSFRELSTKQGKEAASFVKTPFKIYVSAFIIQLC